MRHLNELESDLIGIIGEADAALVSDTVLLSVNDKLVQMAIGRPCERPEHRGQVTQTERGYRHGYIPFLPFPGTG